MSTYATVGDLTARYEGADTSKAQVFLDDAEAYLLARIPTLAARVTSGRTTAAALRIVVCELAMERLRNPAGVASEHAGEYGYSYATNSSGGDELSSRHKVLLGLARGRTSVGTMNLSLAPERTW